MIDGPGVMVFGNYVRRQLRPRGSAGIRVLMHFNTGVFNTGKSRKTTKDLTTCSLPFQHSALDVGLFFNFGATVVVPLYINDGTPIFESYWHLSLKLDPARPRRVFL